MLLFFVTILTGAAAAAASVPFQEEHDDAASLVQVHSMQSPEPPRKQDEQDPETIDLELNADFGWHQDAWEDDPGFPSVPSLSRLPDYRDYPGTYVLLYPAKKLAFCFIPKVACTQFNVLFNRLNGLSERQRHKSPWHRGPWGVSGMAGFGHNFAQTTREKGWKWAVFLRDPLLRYLSAWGSKCVQKEGGGIDCVPAGMYSKGSVADFHENVRQNHNNPKLWAANPHWAPQTDLCGGVNASSYDFIGHLRGNVTAQVIDMLNKVGATGSDVGHYVQEAFPVNRIAGHKSRLDPDKYYDDVSIKRTVKQMYKKDFRLPGMH